MSCTLSTVTLIKYDNTFSLRKNSFWNGGCRELFYNGSKRMKKLNAYSCLENYPFLNLMMCLFKWESQETHCQVNMNPIERNSADALELWRVRKSTMKHQIAAFLRKQPSIILELRFKRNFLWLPNMWGVNMIRHAKYSGGRMPTSVERTSRIGLLWNKAIKYAFKNMPK